MMNKKNIAVIYGGLSSERDISLQSGQAVFEALNTAKEISHIDVTAVDVNENFLQQVLELKQSDVDFVFIALHGGAGEDGSVQAVLDFAGLEYSGSGVQASALALNKLHSKQIWQAQQLPTPKYLLLNRDSTWETTESILGDHIIVKPASEGSSIGMQVANNEASYIAAINDAFQYDEQVIAEQWVEGGEYTVAILGEQTLPPIKLVTDHAFYDFDAKYQSNDTQYLCPCGLSKAQEHYVQQLALQAFKALGCSGWGRVDLMQGSNGDFYLLEVNTVPGLTTHSLVPMAAKAAGFDFQQLVMEIIKA